MPLPWWKRQMYVRIRAEHQKSEYFKDNCVSSLSVCIRLHFDVRGYTYLVGRRRKRWLLVNLNAWTARQGHIKSSSLYRFEGLEHRGVWRATASVSLQQFTAIERQECTGKKKTEHSNDVGNLQFLLCSYSPAQLQNQSRGNIFCVPARNNDKSATCIK